MTVHFGMSLDLLRELHSRGLDKYGGSAGVLHESVLEGIIDNAYTAALYALTDDEQEANPLTFACYLATRIAQSHVFMDGNKRAAWSALVAVLYHEGFRVEADEKEAADLMGALVEHSKSIDDLLHWVGNCLADNS